MNKLTLVGHSGCKLEVQQRADAFVVVKTAKDKSYNPRLERQYKKQSDFAHENFRAPKVLDSNLNPDGLFAFSMEYINGFTLAEYLRQVTVAEIPSLVEQFISLIPAERTFDSNAKQTHQSKLNELKQKIASKEKPVKQALKRLEQHPWEFSVLSYCHGDLTLENIIWKDDVLYLIDFLDSYYDSWMQDFGKLLFDLESLWSYRSSSIDENLRTRISIFKSLLIERLLQMPHGKEMLREIYHFALLHALRIFPYTKDEQTLAQLSVSVEKLQEVIDSL